MQLYAVGKYHLSIVSISSCYMDKMRDELADKVTQCKPDYILWLDADQTYPEDTPEVLMNHIDNGKLIVGGLTPDKTDGTPLVYEMIHPNGIVQRRKTTPHDGVIKVDAMGFGGVMTHPSVFDTLESPYFLMEWDWRIAGSPGEDIRFFSKCKRAGIDVWCDTSLRYGHVVVGLNEFKDDTYTNNIDGWMTETELNWLYQNAKKMDDIVEIGSWKGKSTHALLSGCPGTVWAIDHFKGSPGEPLADPADIEDDQIYKIFMDNVGHFQNLKMLKMSSKEAVDKFKDKSIDMVFIDGAHSIEAVTEDIKMWWPKAKKIICGHDFGDYKVRKVVEQTFNKVDVCQSIWSKEK